MPHQRDPIRDFPGKRWFNLALRTVHLFGLVLLGAGLLGAGSVSTGASIILVSGLTMFAIDTWANPAHLRQTGGIGVLGKLFLVVLMVWQTSWAPAIFWFLLALSTLLSHAPGHFRHRQWL
jgi:hypothetical protein